MPSVILLCSTSAYQVFFHITAHLLQAPPLSPPPLSLLPSLFSLLLRHLSSSSIVIPSFLTFPTFPFHITFLAAAMFFCPKHVIDGCSSQNARTSNYTLINLGLPPRARWRSIIQLLEAPGRMDAAAAGSDSGANAELPFLPVKAAVQVSTTSILDIKAHLLSLNLDWCSPGPQGPNGKRQHGSEGKAIAILARTSFPARRRLD